MLRMLTIVASALLVFVAGAFIYQVWSKSIAEQQQQMRLERIQATIEDIRSGSSAASVWDSALLSAIAEDSECRDAVTSLVFASVEVEPDDAKRVSELGNVTAITFYCSEGTREVLLAATSLPITELSFELSDISANDVEVLSEFSSLETVSFASEVDGVIDDLTRRLPHVEIRLP